MRRTGGLFVLIGLCILYTAYTYAGGYSRERGWMENIDLMEVVLVQGTWIASPPGLHRPPAPPVSPPYFSDPSYKQYRKVHDQYKQAYVKPYKNFTPHHEGRVAFRFLYFLGASLSLLLLGTGMVVLNRPK